MPSRAPLKVTAIKIFNWLVWGLFSVVMIHGALLSPAKIPLWVIQTGDKAIHRTEFFLLFLLSHRAFRQIKNVSPKPSFIAAICYGVFMAALTELLQFWAPGRSPELDDLKADAIGLGVAGLLAFLMGRKKKGEYGLF